MIGQTVLLSGLRKKKAGVGNCVGISDAAIGKKSVGLSLFSSLVFPR